MNRLLILRDKDMDELLDIKEFTNEIEKCFILYSEGKATVPDRSVMDVRGNWWGVMPGYVLGYGVAVKIVSVIPSNKKRGLPTIPGLVVYLDEESGLPLSIMDGAYITGIRTAAASMVSIKYLRPRDSGKVLFIGGGYQARFHLRFLVNFFQPDEVLVYDVNPDAAKRFVEYAVSMGLDSRAVDDLFSGLPVADIIIEASTTESPVVFGSHIKDEVHIVSIGAHTLDSRALDDEVFMVSTLVSVDSRKATMNESGDIRGAVDSGLIEEDKLVELGELKKLVGNNRPSGVTIYKSVGLALQDVCAANYIYRKALEKNVGVGVEL